MTVSRPNDSTPEWPADYDEALRRGEWPTLSLSESVPEDPSAGSQDLRELLHLLNSVLRKPAENPTDQTPYQPETEPDIPPGRPEGHASGFPPLGRFLVQRELGRGSYGAVYLAHDPEMDREVALKLPYADALQRPDTRRLFLNEARAAARLDHPGLVPVYEAGQIGPIYYIAAAYCPGPNLSQWLHDRRTPVEPRAAARLVLRMAKAVAHIHSRGFLHCDLKPGNVLMDPPRVPGGEFLPRITDFGLARLLEAIPLGATVGRPLGTPPYMAPEQVEQRRQAIGPPADIYALGVILYELLTQAHPHDAETPWIAMRAAVSDPPVRPRHRVRSIPRDLEAICLKCLEKPTVHRYPSAWDLAKDLARFLDGRPTQARPLDPVRRTMRWARRDPALAAVITLGILTVGVSLGSSLAVSRANRELNHANTEVRQTLDSERQQRYVATLALAQQDEREGRVDLAQNRLRRWIPGPNEPDRRDFAWYYLFSRTTRQRTILPELMPGLNARLDIGKEVLLGCTPRLGSWNLDSILKQGYADSRISTFQAAPNILNAHSHAALTSDGELAAIYRSGANNKTSLVFFKPRTMEILAEREFSELLLPGVLEFSKSGDAILVGLVGNPNASSLVTTLDMNIPGHGQIRVHGLRDCDRAGKFFNPREVITLRHAHGTGKDRFHLESWDLETGTLRWNRGPEQVGPSLAVSPAPGGPIATTTAEGWIQLRDFQDGHILDEWNAHQEKVWSLAFSNDGQWLASGADRVVGVWKTATRKRVALIDRLGGRISSLAFLTSSDSLAIGESTGRIVLWRPEPSKDRVLERAHHNEIWGLDLSPDGKTFASLGGDRVIHLWNADSGRRIASIPCPGDWPSRLSYRADGQAIATSDFRGMVHLWNVDTGEKMHSIQAHEDRVRALEFGKKTPLLASGGRDGKVRLWNAETMEPIALVGAHTDDVRDLAFLKNDRQIVSVCNDSSVHLWDLDSKTLRVRWLLPGRAKATSVAVSPDDSVIAVGDDYGTVTLWDATNGRLQTTLQSLHFEELSDLKFSPDGRLLAVAGQDGVVTLVDAVTREPHLTLTGHQAGVNRLEFSSKGYRLVSAGHDGSIRIWEASSAPQPR